LAEKISKTFWDEEIQSEIIPSSDDDDNDEEERSIITYEEGKKAFGIFKQYIEQLDHATANDISFLNNLMKKAEKERIDKLKQSKLDLYF